MMMGSTTSVVFVYPSLSSTSLFAAHMGKEAPSISWNILKARRRKEKKYVRSMFIMIRSPSCQQEDKFAPRIRDLLWSCSSLAGSRTNSWGWTQSGPHQELDGDAPIPRYVTELQTLTPNTSATELQKLTVLGKTKKKINWSALHVLQQLPPGAYG